MSETKQAVAGPKDPYESLQNASLDDPKAMQASPHPDEADMSLEVAFVGVDKWPSGDLRFRISFNVTEYHNKAQGDEKQYRQPKIQLTPWPLPVDPSDPDADRKTRQGDNNRRTANTFRHNFGISETDWKAMIPAVDQAYEVAKAAGRDAKPLWEDVRKALAPVLGATGRAVLRAPDRFGVSTVVKYIESVKR